MRIQVRLVNARPKLSAILVSTLLMINASSMAQTVKEEYSGYEGGPAWVSNVSDPTGGSAGSSGAPGGFSGLVTSAAGTTTQGFMGVSQFDLRTMLGGSFIPPDTMGAVGASQFMETTNGVYAIYSKSTGALQSMLRGDTFWNNAGGADFKNLKGDARVMFDKTSQKWIAMSFGNNLADIQIAVSTTSDALGPWKATKFTGYAGGVADYPTLAIDKDAVYIGTNNFCLTACPVGLTTFRGTTLNVLSRADLFGAAPTTTSLKQFITPYSPTTGGADGGFAIQGVNSDTKSGMVMAASLFFNDSIRFDITNPGSVGATKGATTYLGLTDYGGDGKGARQPDGTRNIDAFDQRIGASVWEQNGKIYAVYGAQPVCPALPAVCVSHNEVRWVVTAAATGAVIQEGTISSPDYDYYQASLAVNSAGQVVIGYNRSGFGPDGKVTFMVSTFNSDAQGKLVQTDSVVLHVSDVGNYHNGSTELAPAAGRQRWGDYSAVTLDPNDDQSFWAIGEYAAEWNNVAGGHTGNGGSSWGTWIADIQLAMAPTAVPEPESLALVFAGLLAMGFARRRRSVTTA